MNKTDAVFNYLQKLAHIRNAKTKERNVQGSQKRSLIRDGKYEDLLNRVKKLTCKSLKRLFFLNDKTPIYRVIVGELLEPYKDKG